MGIGVHHIDEDKKALLSGPNENGTAQDYGSTSASSSQSDLRKRRTERTVTKDGRCNFKSTTTGLVKKKLTYDIFTTLLEIKWRWTLLVLCISYFGSWLLFAVCWWLMVYFHGDTQIANIQNENWIPCITGIQNFTSAFLFSLETQQTTGYGYYHLTEQCPHAITLLCVQSIFGVVMEGLMVGLVFVKISHAKKRSETIGFSKNALITLRDGAMYLMFRVADLRPSRLLEVHVRAQLIRKRVTAEGEVIQYHQEELEVGGDGEKRDKILLFWPTVIVHRIDENSPLKDIKESDLNIENTSFEIIVVVEGIIESTGLTTQARSSYLPHEILWGHRFKNMIESGKYNNGERIVNYSIFHETVPVSMKDSTNNAHDELISLTTT